MYSSILRSTARVFRTTHQKKNPNSPLRRKGPVPCQPVSGEQPVVVVVVVVVSGIGIGISIFLKFACKVR